ncbi:MAG: T9SS type A sorting domain-containing protein [Chitinophagales bacterium]|nr:T9SS type A sorting domain-containing protein [Chitinophagales bacterium]
MKTLTTLFSIALALSISIATAQTPPGKQWDARFGGTNNESLNSLQQTADGGYILGGWSQSGISGDKTQASQGGYDYWIVKTDADGIKQWDARFGSSDYDFLHSLQQTADGGYILGGYSQSGISGDKTQASQGLYDYWIVKTDANGVKQWDARFGGSSDDYLNSIQQTADGGYILGGWSQSGISGDKTQASQGSYDYWIVKTDANGVKQWDTRFGGSSDDRLWSLQQTTDGGYILGGYSQSGISGDKTQASQGASDYWIVKTDANGVKQWDARFGGSSAEGLWSLQQTTDGGYILGGESISEISGDKTQASQGDYDYWIVKTDANGVKQWDAQFGGSNQDELNSLQQTADGGYILGGWSGSEISGDKTQASQGSSDYWIVKTDANGVKQWDARFGGNNADGLWSLQQTTDGGYILGGTSSSGISGDKTQSSQGFDDYWIVKTDAVATTTETLVDPVDFFSEIYPNPVQNQLTINMPVPASAVTIRIYDIMGEMISLPTTIQNPQAQINTMALPEGLYTLQITNNKTRASKVRKFVKQ